MKKNYCELSLVNSELTNNKQSNDNKIDSPLSWIIASLGQVAYFTSVVIRKVLATSGWVRFAHTAPYAKSTHNSLVKAIAFTLAETLVVMGIIGVVAALTIPNLNQSTGDREKVAKLKKVYSNLEDAFGRATAVYGPYDTWLNGLSTDEEKVTRFGQRITEFMKVSKNCGLDGTGCFSSSVPTDLDGEKFDQSYDEFGYRVILADGTSVQFIVWPLAFRIRVDIDGPNKGKNQYGNDIFDFYMETDSLYKPSNQIVPSYPYEADGDIFYEGKYEVTGYLGNYATAWIIRNGNMDYLKCLDELNWDTKTSCK